MYAKIKDKKHGSNPEEYDQKLEAITVRLANLRRKCESILEDQGLDSEEIARILIDYRNYENLDHRDLNVKKIMAAYRNKVLPLHDAWAELLKTSPYKKKIEVFDSYNLKNHLKKRGYSYNSENSSWFLMTYSQEQFKQEIEFLKSSKVEIRNCF